MNYYFVPWLITAFLGRVGIKFEGGKDDKSLYLSKSALPCFFLSFLAGMRALSVGADNRTYAAYFRHMTSEKLHLFNKDSHWVYDLWVLLIRFFTDNVYVFNACCAIVVFLCLYKFIHWFSLDEQLSILLFFSLGFFYSSMNQTRQAMSVSLLLLGFYFVIHKKPVLALLLCLAASLIHNVAIVMAPIYLFLSIIPIVSKRTVLIFSCVSTGIAIAYSKFVYLFVMIFPKYRSYLYVEKLFRDKRSIYRYADVLLALLIQIALLIVIVWSDNKGKHDDMACILACINAIYLCMTYLVISGEVFIRVKSIFGYWMIISIPHICVKYMGNNRYLKLLIATLSLLYLWRLGIKDGDSVIPYAFFWNT